MKRIKQDLLRDLDVESTNQLTLFQEREDTDLNVNPQIAEMRQDIEYYQ